MSHDLLTLPRPKTLGAFIKARRVVLGLHQRELAKRLEMEASTISRLESNRFEPKLSMLVDLAKALKVDVQVLIGFVVK